MIYFGHSRSRPKALGATPVAYLNRAQQHDPQALREPHTIAEPPVQCTRIGVLRAADELARLPPPPWVERACRSGVGYGNYGEAGCVPLMP